MRMVTAVDLRRRIDERYKDCLIKSRDLRSPSFGGVNTEVTCPSCKVGK